jgi:hypothetical protein
MPFSGLSLWQSFFIHASPNLKSDEHLFDGEAVSDFAFKSARYDWNAAFQTYGPGGH